MDPRTLGYDEFASRMAKGAVTAFTLVCLFVVFFKAWGFGIWWIAVWAVGVFAISLLVAPFVILEWLLIKKGKKLGAVAVSVTHTLGAFPASYYLLKLVHGWLF
jgi:hypothetical protein